MQIVTTLLTVLVLPLFYVIYVAARNYYGHKYFKKNLPKLPLLDDIRLFGGHIHKVINPRSWRIFHDHHLKVGKNFGYYYHDIVCISTSDLNLIKKVALDDADQHPNRTGPINLAVDEMEVDCIFTAFDEQWRRLRKALSPAFVKHRVMSPNVQHEINEVINKFVDSIEWRLNKEGQKASSKSTVVDAEELFHRYALALVFTCFYKQTKVIDFYSEKDKWQSAMAITAKQLNTNVIRLTVLFPILNYLVKLLLKINHPLGEFPSKINGFIKQQTKLYMKAKVEYQKAVLRNKGEKLDEDNFRLKDGTEFRRNMIDSFIEKYADGTLTEREYIHNSFFIFNAANKTSGDALSRLIYLLASNQHIQEKLRHSILKEGAESTYLLWTINEAMRLFPPAPIGCSRLISKDVKFEFGVIPKGAFLYTSTWTIHRSTEYWGDDAEEFKPERWAQSENFHPMQFIPFGAGRRTCPGREFAIREMQMLLNVLLRRYKFDRTEKTTDSLEFQTPFFVFTLYEEPTWIKISRL